MTLCGHSSWVAPPSIWMTFWFSGSDGHRVYLKSPSLGFVLSPMGSSPGIPFFIPYAMDMLLSCRFIQFLPCVMLLSHHCVSWMASPYIPRWSKFVHLRFFINAYLGVNTPLLFNFWEVYYIAIAMFLVHLSRRNVSIIRIVPRNIQTFTHYKVPGFDFLHWSFNHRFQTHGFPSFLPSSYHPYVNIYLKSSALEDPSECGGMS